MEQETVTSTFVRALVQQIRASDPYGRLDAMSEEILLKPYIVSKEERQAIPIIGDIDKEVEGRLRAFYNAAAAAIEQETGVMVSSLLEMSHEGFGRVILYAGRLILVSKTLRDAHRFGFPTVEKLAAEGEKLVRAGVEMLQRFPEVAQL